MNFTVNCQKSSDWHSDQAN